MLNANIISKLGRFDEPDHQLAEPTWLKTATGQLLLLVWRLELEVRTMFIVSTTVSLESSSRGEGLRPHTSCS